MSRSECALPAAARGKPRRLAAISLARGSHCTDGVRVLLVEDDDRVRSFGELVLRHAGHSVITTAGPLEALDLVKSMPDIGVIVTDIVMPEMNGFDLADEVRGLAPHIRIVFMSGFTRDHFKQSVEAPFVDKPFTPASLALGVQQALGG